MNFGGKATLSRSLDTFIICPYNRNCTRNCVILINKSIFVTRKECQLKKKNFVKRLERNLVDATKPNIPEILFFEKFKVLKKFER